MEGAYIHERHFGRGGEELQRQPYNDVDYEQIFSDGGERTKWRAYVHSAVRFLVGWFRETVSVSRRAVAGRDACKISKITRYVVTR